MTILNPDNTTHILNILPREADGRAYQVTIIDEAQNMVYVHNDVSSQVDGNRLLLTIIQEVRPEAFYYFTVRKGQGGSGDYNSSDYALADYDVSGGSAGYEHEIYRGKAYSTTQTELDKFNPVTIYESPTQTENDYIILTK